MKYYRFWLVTLFSLHILPGFPRVLENLEKNNFIFQAWKTHGKNPETHGKLMEKIFANNIRVTEVREIEFYINNIKHAHNICLWIVMENINFVLENSWKTHGICFQVCCGNPD